VLGPGSPALRHQPAPAPGPSGLVTWSAHPLPGLLGLLNRVHGGGVPLVFTSDLRVGEICYRMRTWWSWHHTGVPSSNYDTVGSRCNHTGWQHQENRALLFTLFMLDWWESRISIPPKSSCCNRQADCKLESTKSRNVGSNGWYYSEITIAYILVYMAFPTLSSNVGGRANNVRYTEIPSHFPE